MSKKSRFLNADLIRVVAMLMVIMLHTILNFTIRPDFFATKLWFLFEPIIILSKTCVLLFFMLSGYLVIAKNKSLRENTTQTVRKILLPLAFFTGVNLVYAYTKFDFATGNFGELVVEQLRRMASFPSSPMWFLVVLAFLYLLNPIWGLVFSESKNKQLAQALTAAALFFSLLITFIEFPALKSGQMFTSFTGWLGFVFFYLYGGLVQKNWALFNNQRFNLLLIGAGFLLTFAGDYLTMWQKVNGGSFIWSDYTGNYLSIPVTMMAVGIFNFLISLNLSKYKWPALTFGAGLSYGIYLIHTYIISLFTDIIGFDFNQLQMNVYLYNVLNVVLVLGLSAVLTFVWKKIPYFKSLIGG